ncbi:LTA synthase family protein [Cellvibrio sp. UBA7671]|uniref:LTA synthase family protein n=1 Tax=Cellvibrio sp. UBA7671 TaxID=1946312 RepID=UPI002F357CA8
MPYAVIKLKAFYSALAIVFVFIQLLIQSGAQNSGISIIFINVLNICSSGLVLLLLGAHLGKLFRTYQVAKIFYSALLIHILLQYFYYSIAQYFQPSMVTEWFIPVGPTHFTAACLIGLILVQIDRVLHQKKIVMLLIMLGILGLIYTYINFHLSLCVLSVALGYYLEKRQTSKPAKDTFCHLLISQQIELWFLSALILSFFSAILFAVIGASPTMTYAGCFGFAVATLVIAVLPITVHFLSWWIDWVSWASRTKISPAQQVGSIDKRFSSSYELLAYFQKSVLWVLTLIFLAIVMVEVPVRGWEINELIRWVENSFYFFSISAFTICLIYFVVRFFLARIAAALFTIALILLVSVINYLKVQFLGVPLMPTDFHMVNQAFDSLIFIAGKQFAVLIYGAIFSSFIGFIYLLWKFPSFLVNRKIWAALRGLIAFGLILGFLHYPNKVFDESRIPNAWDMPGAAQLYTYSGFFPSFIYKHIAGFTLEKPENYSSNSVNLLAQASNIKVDVSTEKSAQIQPHVIVIQSEAFWDPGQLADGLFPEGSPGDLDNLCSTLSTLESNCASGYVEVPSFGGMTANTEFEFLTGIALKLFPGVSVPFVHFIEKPMPSIVWRFHQAGYKTLGIHASEGWFWGRDKSYPLLGFSEFKDVDYFKEAERNKLYVTDRAINGLILQQLQQAQEPQFIFTVTMANHGPFEDDRYQGLPPISINWSAAPQLPESEHQILTTYSIGVRESRDALAELISEFQQQNSPPVTILFYGDHLPILGANFKIYHETGFKPESIGMAFQEFYSTPYLVWSNQPFDKSWPRHMPITFFGQRLTQMAGLGESGLEKTIDKLRETNFFNKPTRADLLNGNPVRLLSDEEKQLRLLYKHAFFDAFFNQGGLGFFGITDPFPIVKPE